MPTKRQWNHFERWENEESAKRLQHLTHAQALALADAMYDHALQMSPETVKRRPQSWEEWLNSDDVQTMMRVRRAFGMHSLETAR